MIDATDKKLVMAEIGAELNRIKDIAFSSFNLGAFTAPYFIAYFFYFC